MSEHSKMMVINQQFFAVCVVLAGVLITGFSVAYKQLFFSRRWAQKLYPTSYSMKNCDFFRHVSIGMLLAVLTINCFPMLAKPATVKSRSSTYQLTWNNWTCENSKDYLTLESTGQIPYVELSVCVVFFTFYFIEELLEATVRFRWLHKKKRESPTNCNRDNHLTPSCISSNIYEIPSSGLSRFVVFDNNNCNNSSTSTHHLSVTQNPLFQSQKSSLPFVLSYAVIMMMEGCALGTHKTSKVWTALLAIFFHRLPIIRSAAKKVFRNEDQQVPSLALYVLMLSMFIPIGLILVLVAGELAPQNPYVPVLFSVVTAGVVLADIVIALRLTDQRPPVIVRFNGLFQFLAIYGGFNVILCLTFILHNV